MSYDQENQKIKNLSFITNDHLLNLVLDENSEFNS